MNSTRVPVMRLRETDTFKDEIEAIYDQIMKRAYDMSCECGAPDIDAWLAAERELVVKPLVEMTCDAATFTAKIDLPPLRLIDDVEILTMSADILFKAQTDRHPVQLFRTIHLPRKIDKSSLEACFVQNSLTIRGRFSEPAPFTANTPRPDGRAEHVA